MPRQNANRDYRIFEEFARKLIEIAQNKRIDAPFDLNGKFYAFDSTAINLCFSLFWWAKFRSTKSGIKAHTLFDVVTQIPAYINITNANVHDTQAMDDIPYEPNAYYIRDRGYFDLSGRYKINIIDSYFIIRQKGRLKYKIVDGEYLVEGVDGVISDQTYRISVQKEISWQTSQNRVLLRGTQPHFYIYYQCVLYQRKRHCNALQKALAG